MCGYASEGAPATEEDLLAQFERAMQKFSSQDQMVKIYTSGSFLDPMEVPPQVREKILRALRERGVRRLVLESRPEYIVPSVVTECLSKIDTEFAIGLESSNDLVREKTIRKGFSWQDFVQASETVHDLGGRIKAYILLKPPHLSEKEAIRDAVGPDVDILIEMHGRFNPATAIDIARELAPFKPGWFEEPVPPENLAALKKVAGAVAPLGIPIATGERLHTPFEFRELFELQAADIVQVDPTHYGGLLWTKKLAGWAEAYYMLMAPHNVGGPVSTAAALHLAAATPNFKIQEHFNDFAEAFVKDAAPGVPAVKDGYFPLPQGPGLGVTLDEDLIRAHPQRELHFNLFANDWHKRQAELR
jgi:hypothetical protein